MWREYWWIILTAILVIPLICVAVFGWWIQRHTDIDVEKGVKCWDVFVKLISALTIVVSGAMVFGKYIDQQASLERQQTEQQKRELNLKKAEFLRQKVQFDTERQQTKKKLFGEVKELVARLSIAHSAEKADLKRFEEMYFASLIGVEKYHGPVEAAMVRFRDKLIGSRNTPTDSLEQLSLQLSQACETELKETEDSLIEQYRQITELITAVKVE